MGTPLSPLCREGLRAGSPQFEQYKSQIILDEPEATEAKRALGDIVMTLQTTVRNLTGKTLTGLEITAAVVDYEGKPVKQRAVLVIPDASSGAGAEQDDAGAGDAGRNERHGRACEYQNGSDRVLSLRND